MLPEMYLDLQAKPFEQSDLLGRSLRVAVESNGETDVSRSLLSRNLCSLLALQVKDLRE